MFTGNPQQSTMVVGFKQMSLYTETKIVQKKDNSPFTGDVWLGFITISLKNCTSDNKEKY